jgi:hypothetical protein
MKTRRRMRGGKEQYDTIRKMIIGLQRADVTQSDQDEIISSMVARGINVPPLQLGLTLQQKSQQLINILQTVPVDPRQPLPIVRPDGGRRRRRRYRFSSVGRARAF